MRRDEMVKRISIANDLPTKVVSDTLDSLIGVLIEELVSTGKTGVYGLFKMSSFERPGYQTTFGYVPPQDTLRVKISTPIKNALKWFGPSTGRSSFITSENWRERLKWMQESQLEVNAESNNDGNEAHYSSESSQLDDLLG